MIGTSAGDGIHDEDVEPDWRGGEADADDDQDQDAEPDRGLFGVEAEIQRHHDREEDGESEEDHGELVHDPAQDDVEDEKGRQHGIGRQAQTADQVGGLERQLGEGEEGVEDLGTEEDQEDHCRQLGRLQQAFAELGPAEPALRQTHDGGRDGADGRTLGGREHAAIDPADNDDGDQQGGPDLEQAAAPLGADDARSGGPGGGIAADAPGNGQHVEEGGQQAGDEGRHEQLGDVLLGRDRIDDQDHRGRDQDAEGPTDGERAGRQGRRVAVTAQLGIGGTAHRGGGGDRGAADGAEGGAGADRSHRHPTAAVADQSAGGLEQRLGEARSARPRPPS